MKNENSQSLAQIRGWKLIWGAAVPQWICMFLWLAAQGRLMTNVNLFVNIMTEDPRCYACGMGEENIEQILRICPAARVVWHRLGWQDNDSSLGGHGGPFRDWLLKNR